ncbi:MAG: hypothetical protein RIE73_02460 [Coleofasciculus sp. C1-SOL-03]
MGSWIGFHRTLVGKLLFLVRWCVWGKGEARSQGGDREGAIAWESRYL